MPVVSQAQRRWAYATAEGKTDAPASVGKEFVEASHGITGLPARKHKQAGAASSRSQQRYMGYLKANPQEAAQRGIPPAMVDNLARGPGGTIQGLPQHIGNAVSTQPKLRRFGQLAP